jgi:hypothetical protein
MVKTIKFIYSTMIIPPVLPEQDPWRESIKAPCSKLQGILYCKEFCQFNIRSLTPQPRKAGFPLRSNPENRDLRFASTSWLRGMRSLLQFKRNSGSFFIC